MNGTSITPLVMLSEAARYAASRERRKSADIEILLMLVHEGLLVRGRSRWDSSVMDIVIGWGHLETAKINVAIEAITKIEEKLSCRR